MIDIVREELLAAQSALAEFIGNEEQLKTISLVAGQMSACIRNGGKIISCGNGGSMSDAMHFAEELSGRYRDNRKALPAIAISDAGYLSCVANDFGYQFVFSRFIEAFAQPKDVLLAISTSGNSANIIQALKTARSKSMTTVLLSGKDGGEAANFCDLEIRAPYSQYADRAQEIHIKVIHILIRIIEKNLLT
jgi:D-sedoheptulose 7-phosphate isomerase